MVPPVGANSPETLLIKFVLRAPLGRRMARRPPGFTTRVTSATARRPPNRLPTPLKWRIGAAVSLLGGAAFTPLCVMGPSAEADRDFVPHPRGCRLLDAGWVGPVDR